MLLFSGALAQHVVRPAMCLVLAFAPPVPGRSTATGLLTLLFLEHPPRAQQQGHLKGEWSVLGKPQGLLGQSMLHLYLMLELLAEE